MQHLEKLCEQRKLLRLSLQFFAEGSGDGGGAATEATGGNETAPAGGGEVSTDTQKSEATEKVYSPEEVAAVAKQAHLIPHNAVKERYKRTFDNADKYNALSTHMRAVAEKYGVSLEEPEKLARAIMTDPAIVKAKASEMGVSNDVAQTMIEADVTNAINSAREKDRVQQEEFDRMSREEGEVKQTYPTFDFDKASQNPAFKVMVDNGIPMKTAYEMSHHAELTQAAITAAVKQARAEALAEARAAAERPREGAAGHKTGNAPTDVSKLHGAALDAFLESFTSRR
jgi:hypothetical protein